MNFVGCFSKIFWVFYGCCFIRLVVFWLGYAKVSPKVFCGTG
ncbi:hypothetical protein [uncultured Gammaproteobacteria bacterium]|nr:hypothetical protein [uncultured Gammaproteobacteria bacterium]CAC9978787.1 hypothetical protein [uncultured Gammaproteobacteria bacterium]